MKRVVLLLAALPLMPLASAAPLQAAFEQTGTTTFTGHLAGTADLAYLDLHAPGRQVVLETAQGSHRLMSFARREVEANLPGLRPWEVPLATAPSYGEEHEAPERMRLDFPAGPALVRFIPAGGPSAWSVDGDAAVQPPGSRHEVEDRFAIAHVQDAAGVDVHPAGPYALAAAHGQLSLELGAGLLVVDGPTAWAPAPVGTGLEEDPAASAQEPATRSGLRSQQGHLLLITVQHARLACDCAVDLAWRRVAGELDGVARWQGIQGRSDVDGQSLPADLETLEASGQYSWTADASATPAHWTVQGETRWVNANAQPAWRPGLVAGAVGAGFALLAALGLLAKGKALLSLLRSRLGLEKAEVLDGQARGRILEAVHEHQPVTLPRLRELTGLSRGNLRYHLRMLEAHEVLQSVLPEGHLRRDRAFMLNSGSLMFRPAAARPQEDQHRSGTILSAAAPGGLRRAILEVLLEEGPLPMEGIRAALARRGAVAHWPRSTASYQLGKLVAAQAIGERRDGRTKLYFAEIDPKAARARQYASYFVQSGNGPLMAALAAGPMGQQELADRLRRAGAGVDHLRGRLDRLCRLAILHQPEPGLFAVRPGIPVPRGPA